MKWKSAFFIIFIILISNIGFGQKAGKKSPETITITGKVLTNSGKPVAGAVFYIDNTRTTNITKSDGSYKIKVGASVLNLEVRSSEYGSFKTPINGQTTLNFTLDGDNNQVSTPADARHVEASDKPENKTSGSKGRKINTYNDIYQMIRGEVSDVVVSGKSVQIRQGHSFFGSTTPLFVVNGVIVTSIDNINPMEVKSIKILKGSEKAIYGVQGTNGVISITLLNGSEREK